MAQIPFSTEWLKQFSDPYAVLGLSVTADDRRVLRRYRSVAKQLHPDTYVNIDEAVKRLASQLLAQLINPAYQQLKQDKGRAEVTAMLRIRVRSQARTQNLTPQHPRAQQLINVPPQALDMLYEQAIAELAETQYQNLDRFESVTTQLAELNAVYLHLKMGEPLIREKRTGMVPAADAKPIQFTPVSPNADKPAPSYAERHYQRAQEYLKKSNWSMAVQELRDAIRLESTKSEYHALLAVAYLMQDLPGMAKVHCRQALKLNPKNPIALKYAQRLKISVEEATQPQNNAKNSSAKAANRSGFFGMFGKR